MYPPPGPKFETAADCVAELRRRAFQAARRWILAQRTKKPTRKIDMDRLRAKLDTICTCIEVLTEGGNYSAESAEAIGKAISALPPAAEMRLAAPPTQCPWCPSKAAPVATDPNVANFKHLPDTREGRERHMQKNPAMCPDCHGVGGWEDWGLGLHNPGTLNHEQAEAVTQ